VYIEEEKYFKLNTMIKLLPTVKVGRKAFSYSSVLFFGIKNIKLYKASHIM